MDKQTSVCISCFKSVGHMADCVKEEGSWEGGYNCRKDKGGNPPVGPGCPRTTTDTTERQLASGL